MKADQEAFKEMKEYQNDITKENLELIRMHKDKLIDIRKQIEQNQEMVEHLKEQMKKLKEPMEIAIEDRNRL